MAALPDQVPAAGYSGTPLPRKLGLRDGQAAAFIGLPEQLAFLAEELNPDLLQGIDVFSVLHGLQSLRDQRIQVFHVQTPDTK